MFSQELLNSNEYRQHTIINKEKRKSPLIIPNIIMSVAMGYFPSDS